MKRSITMDELRIILEKIPKRKIERKNNSWGDCSVYYDKLVYPYEVISEAEKYLKKINKKKE